MDVEVLNAVCGDGESLPTEALHPHRELMHLELEHRHVARLPGSPGAVLPRVFSCDPMAAVIRPAEGRRFVVAASPRLWVTGDAEADPLGKLHECRLPEHRSVARV